MTAAAIGFDVGTSGVRAAMVDEHGALLGVGTAGLAPSERRDPASWSQAVESALTVLERFDSNQNRVLRHAPAL